MRPKGGLRIEGASEAAAAVVARMHDFIHEAVCSSLRVLQTLQTQARRLDS